MIGVFAVSIAVKAQTIIYSESFEDTLGWTLSNKFDDGFEDYILHDSVAKINARSSGPDFTIHGADSAYVIAFEDINSGDPGSVSSNGFAEIKIDSIPIMGYDSLKVWLAVAANPTSNRYDNALNSFGNGDSMGVWASIDGGAYSRVMFFCAPDSNAAKTSTSNTGSLYFDSNNNFIGGDANDVAIDDTLESFNSMVTGKGSYMSVRILLRTESGDEEIVLDNFRVQGTKSTTCADPSAMMGAQLSTTSYSVTWTSGSSLSNLEYGPQGYTQGSGTMVSNVTSPYTISGLTSGNSYDVYYQDTCATIGTSNWVGPYTFTLSSAPSVLDIWRTSSTNIMVAFSDTMQSLVASSTSRYKGITGLSSVTLNAGSDTATLNYSTPFADGVLNTLTVDSVLSASLVLLDTSYTFSFVYNGSTPNIVINEIMYNDQSGPDTLEYLELHNAGATAAAVGGMEFTSGITMTIPAGVTMAPGSYLVLARSAANHSTVFGNSVVTEWTGGGLSNSGETIEISNSEGTVIDVVSYDDENGWPSSADGRGYSLVLCDPTSDNNLAASWGLEPAMFRSSGYYASPGVANTCRPPFVPNTYKIATITSADANGEADSLGVVCYTSGTVFTNDFDGNSGYSFYIMDETGGINVFNRNDIGSFQVREGDSIRVRGEIEFYRGLIEIVPDSIWVLDSNKSYPGPKVVTTLDESTESEYIEIEGVRLVDPTSWPNGGSRNVDLLTPAGDTLTMRIDSDVNIDSIAPNCFFTVRGVGSQFDFTSPYTSGYQIFPRWQSDIRPDTTQMSQTVTNVTTEGADVSWMAAKGSTKWNIGWAMGHSSTKPTDSTMGVTTNPYTITGLDTNTHYHVWIQDECAEPGYWNGPVMFSTEQDTTSIKELLNAAPLVIFPNPNSTGKLRLNKVTSVVIRNLLGQPVLEAVETDEIDINALVKGVYLIEAAEGETQKLIVE